MRGCGREAAPPPSAGTSGLTVANTKPLVVYQIRDRSAPVRNDQCKPSLNLLHEKSRWYGVATERISVRDTEPVRGSVYLHMDMRRLMIVPVENDSDPVQPCELGTGHYGFSHSAHSAINFWSLIYHYLLAQSHIKISATAM